MFRKISCLMMILFLNCLSYTQNKPALISSINFTGNDYFSSPQLQSFGILKTGAQYSAEQFELDLKNIIKNYQQEGFLEFKIEKATKDYNFDSSSVSLTAAVYEGKQTVIGEILIDGNKLFTSGYLLSKMFTKTGKPFDARVFNQDVSQILNLYEAKGYPFALVTLTDIVNYSNKDKPLLQIKVKIDESDKIKIDKIVIEGNTATNEEVITREIRLGKNNSVTRDGLTDIRRRLENLRYFETVEQPKILKYKNTTVLLIKLTEGNTNTFDGIIGYVPPPSNTESGYFTGLVNLSLRNLFGTGRTIEARFQKEVRTTQELELKYSEPWLLGLPLNFGIGFLQRIEDTIYVKRTLNLRAETLISKYFTISGLANIERVIPTASDFTTSFYSVFDSRMLAAGVELKFDSRDYVYNPYSGVLYKSSYTIGQKKIYNAASFPTLNIQGDFTVQKYTGDFDFYHSFFKRQSILIGVHAGEIKSPRYEISDYFRFGGTNSVRGYRDNQFLATGIIWSNMEFRYSLSRKTFASLFYDMGYYRKPEDDITHSPLEQAFIYGYGVGVRIETALGIFGVSYALGKGDSFLEGKVHFGLINDF